MLNSFPRDWINERNARKLERAKLIIIKKDQQEKCDYLATISIDGLNQKRISFTSQIFK